MIKMISRNGGAPTPLNRAINNLQGKLKNSFLNNYPHHTVPGYNLSVNPSVENYDEDHLMQLFKQFPYDSNLPRPLLPPARIPQCVLKNEDPALQLLSIKSEIKDDINRVTEFHEKHRSDFRVCLKKNVKWNKNDDNDMQTSLPRYVAELAEIMESDPDPQFKGEYNWYYTGGSLEHLDFFGKNILVFPYAQEIVAAPIIDKPKSSWKPNLKIASKCVFDGTMYEIRYAVTSDNTCRILGRQKYSCNLYSLSEIRGRLELLELHKEASDLPYISADLNPIESNKYCMANNKRLVEVKDLNRMNCLSSISLPKVEDIPDNWMSIKFHQSDPNLISIVDRCCLSYIDLRTPLDRPSLMLCPKDDLETCESLSLNTASKHNPFYQYLGTYHNLLLCDTRFGNSCVVQKWTHQFKSPPLFCHTLERNDEEIVTLSSQFSGENSVILNTWTSETQAHSHSLPRMPSSITETLRACQDEGKCLDPNMRCRLELCNAGSTLNLNQNNEVTFFTQNSIGDVFYQCITHEEKLQNTSQINKKSLLALNAWEEACLKKSATVKPLAVSEKVNMKHITNGMKNVNLRWEYKDPVTTDFQPKWFQSIAELNSYVDILAPELLAVWDVRQDTVPKTVTSHEKVLSWLEKKSSQNQSLVQSQEDTSILNETEEIFSQELISVSQNIQQPYTPNNTLTEEIVYDVPALETTQENTPDNTLTKKIVYDVPASQTMRKKVAKKRKRISGF